MLTKSKIKKAGHNISHLPVDDPRYQEALQVFTVPPENIFGNFTRDGYYEPKQETLIFGGLSLMGGLLIAALNREDWP